MTIYLVKWTNKTTNQKSFEAGSSLVKAQKKLRDVNKDPELEVLHDTDGNPITTAKVKTQSEVIDLINSL